MYAEGTAFNVQLLAVLSLDSLNLLSQPFGGAVSEDVLGRAAPEPSAQEGPPSRRTRAPCPEAKAPHGATGYNRGSRRCLP